MKTIRWFLAYITVLIILVLWLGCGAGTVVNPHSVDILAGASGEYTKERTESTATSTTTPKPQASKEKSGDGKYTPIDGGKSPLEIKTGIPNLQNLNIPMAGEHDDNEEYQYYLKFMNDKIPVNKDNYGKVSGIETIVDKIQNRNIIAVYDKMNQPLYEAEVTIEGKKYRTYQDGELIFYPKSNKKIKVNVKYGNKKQDFTIAPGQLDRFQLNMDLERQDLKEILVDIVFLMDTTGSMGDEINMLRDTLYSIYTRIKSISVGNINVRFGMVLYRDTGDSYVTKEFQLTDNIEKFQEFLFLVDANGGGDYPEDMIAGFNKTLKINWNKNAIKLVFLITDAPAHIKDYNIFNKMIEQAVENQIKVFSIGASGLDIVGEIQLRLLSQMTKGKFIFLTYGETGESSGAGTSEDPGKVSHHTGANYESHALDDIVVNNVKQEIYFQASQSVVATLQKDFDYKNFTDEIFRRVDNAIQQIFKQVGNKTQKKTVLVLPPDADDENLKPMSLHIQSLSEQILTSSGYIKVVERENLPEIIKEIKLRIAGITESDQDFHQLAGADTILASRLYFVGQTSVYFVKLISTSDGQVMAAAMVKI